MIEICYNCTTIIVGKSASKTGYPLVTHTNDSDGKYDSRLMKIPRTKFEKGTKRPIFPDTFTYPRLVNDHLGPDFSKANVTPQ